MKPYELITIGLIIASAIVLPGAATYAQDAKVKTAMDVLKSQAEKLGSPKIDGADTVAGKNVPAIYFGSANELRLSSSIAAMSSSELPQI